MKRDTISEVMEVVTDGDAIRIELGASPKIVRVINKSTGAVGEWDSSMANGELLVVSDGGGGGGTGLKTSDGITLIDAEINQSTGIYEIKSIELGQLADFNDAVGEALSFHVIF